MCGTGVIVTDSLTLSGMPLCQALSLEGLGKFLQKTELKWTGLA